MNKNLVNLRKEHRLTQEQMAEKLDMSRNGYAKLERGESKLNIEHLQQIANVFNLDVVELLKENGDFSVLVGDNNGNYANKYYGNQQEIEKLQLIIAHKDELLAHKDKIIAQKDKEIELLRQLLDNMSSSV